MLMSTNKRYNNVGFGAIGILSRRPLISVGGVNKSTYSESFWCGWLN